MSKSFDVTDNAIQDLINLMRRLRDPETGCPWDNEQTFETIAPYTIEEAYEVADAISRQNTNDLKEELGDLFLQVVFHSQIAQDEGLFDLNDVARGIVDKMVRRHPHVFDEVTFTDKEAQTTNWESLKEEERNRKSQSQKTSALDGVAVTLPALTRAEKLLKRAARTGFDWPAKDDIVEKLQEELNELAEADASGDPESIEEEMGDVLLVVANLARKHKIDPETALRRPNQKFTMRFQKMEEICAQNHTKLEQQNLDDTLNLWKEAKSELAKKT
jgi:MazG family protein